MISTFRTLAWATAISAGLISAAPAEELNSGTTADIVQTRSQVRHMTPGDQGALQTGMHNRMQSMSAGERNLYQQMNSRRTPTANGVRYGKGGSNGSGNQYRHQHRYQYGQQQGSHQAHAGTRGGGSGGGRGRGR